MIPLLMTLLSPALAGETLYTQVDLLRLRASASSSSSIVTRLRINTPVELLSRQGQRVQVRLPDRPEDHAVQGWLDSSLLAAEPLTWEYSVFQARSATDPQQALLWAERAVAIDPGPAEGWALVQEQASALGLSRRAEEAQDQLLGIAPVYFASCDGQRVVVNARYFPGIGFQDLARGWELGEAQQAALLAQLSTTPWYVAEEGQARLLPGTPFATPFWAPVWNEDGESPWEAGLSFTDNEPDKLVLGACPAGARTLSTAPLRGLSTPSLRAEPELPPVSRTRPVTVEQGRAPTPGPWNERRETVPWTWWDCGEESRVEPATLWALVDDAGQILASFGADARRRTGREAPVSVGESRWYSLELGPNSVTLASLDVFWYTGSGRSWLILDEQGESELLHVMLVGAGC